MSKVGGALAAGTAVAVLLGAAAPAASAAVTCAFDPSTAVAAVDVTGAETVTIARASGGAITVGGAPCGDATATTTDRIVVTGDGAGQTVALGLALPLRPGKTLEGTIAASEIEVYADLRDGWDELALEGGSTADVWTLGTTGGNLNADGDGDDVRSSGVDEVRLASRGGADVLSLAGDAVTGSPLLETSTILAGQGADTIAGGDWNDDIHADGDDPAVRPATGGADRVSAGHGFDRVFGGPGADDLSGEEHPDQLCGGAGNDTLSGGDDDDHFEGAQTPEHPCFRAGPDGTDTYLGGDGTNDRVDYSRRTSALRVTLDGLANDGAAGEGDRVAPDVEAVAGGAGDDVLDAGTLDAPNVLTGNGGDDTLLGAGGEDELAGGAGADTLNAGTGRDGLLGGDGADELRGGDGPDYLAGGTGGDRIHGEAGWDIVGEPGERDGPDLISGGTGVDGVQYVARQTDTRVSLNDIADDGEDAAHDGVAEEGDNVRVDVENVKTGSGDDVVTANTGAANAIAARNEIYGGDGDDRIEGGAGEDQLWGFQLNYYRDGDDTIIGGPGEDTVNGGDGADRLYGLDGEFDSLSGGFGDDDVDRVMTADPFDLRQAVP